MAPLDDPLRTDETQKRLLDWTYSQPPSERLAAQILDAEGYEDIDPSHPLGGPDGGRDGECTRDGVNGVWAVYFPRGQQTLKEIEDKLKADIVAARKHDPKFLAFVTNQEIRISERDGLRKLGGDIKIDTFHLERVAAILDRPHMAGVREQFLRIPAAALPPMNVMVSVVGPAHAFTDDDRLVDAFVAVKEDQIRKRSDEGHERVRKEQEAKERELRAQRAREAAERAQAARERPWDFAARMPSISELVTHNRIFDNLIDMPRIDMPRIGPPHMLGSEPPKPPEPLSEEQIEERVARYRAGLQHAGRPVATTSPVWRGQLCGCASGMRRRAFSMTFRSSSPFTVHAASALRGWRHTSSRRFRTQAGSRRVIACMGPRRCRCPGCGSRTDTQSSGATTTTAILR